jgi:hypothetical protein
MIMTTIALLPLPLYGPIAACFLRPVMRTNFRAWDNLGMMQCSYSREADRNCNSPRANNVGETGLYA